MINIGLYYKAREGREEEFEKIFTGVISLLKSSNLGFLSGKLYREVGGSREYLLYTEWESVDSFRKFMESKEYAETIEYGKNVIEGRPKHKIFQG